MTSPGSSLRAEVQQQAVALARAADVEAEDHASSPSDALERAQHVEHAVALEAALAAEVGRALAEDVA